METWDVAAIAFILLAFAAFAGRFERSVVTPAIFFTSAGLLAGPALGLIDLHLGAKPVKLLAEATLTLVLFADASRISFPALRTELAVPARLLGIGLPLTIAAGTLAGIGVLPGVSLVEALVLSIMLACTDAALGQAVVTDERIPSRIRQGLNVESGLNDGICVPLFFIALGIAEWDDGTLTAHSAVHLVLEEIGYGLVAGIAAGVLGALALRVAARRSLVEPHWLQILTVASALLAAGIATRARRQHLHRRVHRRIPVRPRRSRHGRRGLIPGRRGRRAPQRRHLHRLRRRNPRACARRPRLGGPRLRGTQPDRRPDGAGRALAARDRARRPTLAFVGWFGPRGLATIVFAVIMIDESSLPHERVLLHAVVATIGISVLAHGLTARPLTNRYVRWYASHPREQLPPMESVPAASHRWRKPRARTEPA